MDMTVIFYPGIIPLQLRQQQYLWWRPEAPVKHNHVLVSYAIVNGEPIRPLLRPDLDIMGDSGAVQLYNKGISVPISRLVTWQEENCDWGVPLDIFVGDFNSRLKLSLRNFEEHLKYAQGKCKFLLPIHGPSVSEFKEWWNSVKHLADDYDGLAIPSLLNKMNAPPAKYNPSPLFRSIPLGFCIGKTDVFHHFAVGQDKSRLILIAWAQRYFKRVSIDASSYFVSGAVRIFKTPKFWNKEIDVSSKVRKEGGRRTKLTKLPCLCPACRMFEKEILENSASPIVENYIMEHQLYQDLEYLHFLDALSTDEELFLEYVKDVDPTLLRDIEFLECCAKEGFDIAYQKFGGLSVWT